MQPSRLTLAILWSVWCAQRVRANLELLKDIGDVDVPSEWTEDPAEVGFELLAERYELTSMTNSL